MLESLRGESPPAPTEPADHEVFAVQEPRPDRSGVASVPGSGGTASRNPGPQDRLTRIFAEDPRVEGLTYGRDDPGLPRIPHGPPRPDCR